MANELIINASLPETRIALLEDGQIQELLIERASGKGIVGNIYKGRVTRVLPGMQAAFVDIGLEKAAFLYVDDVYVHSEIWEEEEEPIQPTAALDEIHASETEQASGEVPRIRQLPKPVEPGQAPPGMALNEGASSAGTEKLAAERLAAEKLAEENLASHPNEAGEQEWVEESADYSSEAGSEIEEEEDDVDEDEGSEEEIEEGEDAVEIEDDIEGEDDDEEDEDETDNPVKMGPQPRNSKKVEEEEEEAQPEGTVAPSSRESNPAISSSAKEESEAVVHHASEADTQSARDRGSAETPSTDAPSVSSGTEEAPHQENPVADSQNSDTSKEGHASLGSGGGYGQNRNQNMRRPRRGRRNGRFRRRVNPQDMEKGSPHFQNRSPENSTENYPDNYQEQLSDTGFVGSDRESLVEEPAVTEATNEAAAGAGRPEVNYGEGERRTVVAPVSSQGERPEFRAHRSRDRRIRQKASTRFPKHQVNIQDLLKEGQEVLVQVAKDPIATKGARLTCHISLPGRHLVCMPTIDHVGVSRRIERDDERRRLREFVERNRPRNLGFIVRTASGKQSERRIKQDIEYLTRLWTEIKEKAAEVTAPALVYEDLNAVLRSIRDWVTEEIDKIIVDSRYHFNEIQRFVSHFMPPLRQKVELYHGDIPIFDAYGISTELSRALERKVWLKSGGYIVIDQAEALVAIDVNTGRYVGKKNLEDTILKTNLEAVQEIAYQLRLRNCGGIIILDLIDMEKEENKQRVYRALEDALMRDRARPSILKISELGLIEMTRKRTRDTIIRTLCESCTHCEGKGFIKSKQTVAYEVMREVEREGIERDVGKILIQAHPDVIDILAIDERETLDLLERRYRKQIYLQAVGDFHPEQFEVSADKRERSDRGRDYSGRDHSHSDRSHDSNSDRNRGRERQRYEGYQQHPVAFTGSGEDSVQSGGGSGSGQVSLPQPLPQPLAQPRTQSTSPSLPQPLPQPLSSPMNSSSVSGNSTLNPTGSSSGNMGSGNMTADNFGNSSENLIENSSGNSIENGSGNISGDHFGSSSGNSSVNSTANPSSPSVPPSGTSPSHSSSPGVPGQDGFYDEEDRLAFLRAQAAQDAALARLSQGHTTRNSPDAANRGDRMGGRRNVRGRRGGTTKFRRTPDRSRSSKPYGYNSPSKWNGNEPTPVKEGPLVAAPTTVAEVKDPSPSIPSSPSTSSEHSQSGSGGSGGRAGEDRSFLPI